MNGDQNHMSSPFKFLDAYGSSDRDMYFGRDEEIQELYERLFETNLVLLYGPSGTGKTSLIRCGLANLFKEADWLPLFVRREKNLSAIVRHTLVKAFPENRQPKNLDQLALPEIVRQLYLVHFRPVYLVFDQFEELFILGAAKEAETFFVELSTLLQSEVPAKILLSMREEYIAYLSDYEHIVPELFDNRMRLEKMGRQKLQTVIAKTAAYFDIEIVDLEQSIAAIIDNLRDNRGEVELANLQIYLDKLYRNDWERRKSAGEMNQSIYFDADLIRQTSKIEDVLSDFLEEQVMILEQELANKGYSERGLPMTILLELVTEDATKRISTSDQIRQKILGRKKIDAQLIDHCIDRFTELRLIKILGTEQAS